MLQQHAPLGVERQQARGAEATPVLLARRRDDPGVARVARAGGPTRLTGSGRDDRHLLPACHTRGASATGNARRGVSTASLATQRWRFSRTRMLMTIGVPSKP